MKSKQRFTGAFALGLVVAVVGLAFSSVSRPDYREVSFVHEPLGKTRRALTGEITGSMTVGQTVRATRTNLARIDVFLSNYGRRNRSPVVLTIGESRTDRLIRRSIAPPGTIADNRYYTFSFPAITQSKGRSFMITLTSPESMPGQAVTAWLNDGNPYPRGSAFVNSGRQFNNDLVATLGYQVDSVTVELVNRVSQYKPGFFKGRWLKILALGTLLVAVGSAGAVAASVIASSDSVGSRKERLPLTRIREG